MMCSTVDEVRSDRSVLVLAMVREFGDTPEARRRVARVEGVHERTIRNWGRREDKGEALVCRRGRRPTEVVRERRQALIGALLRLGPCAGVPVLRALFCDIPYRVIDAFKKRFWRVWRRRRGWFLRKLRWQHPGRVWATDFTKPEATLDEGDGRLFLVRDLASGAKLCAVRCSGERAIVVGAALVVLFAAFGAPLVLKHDGGGAFTAKATQALLRAHGVTSLRSPPRTPQYNGSCERSGGTFKQRVRHQAALAGHPGHWTDIDTDAALWQTNHTPRPFGPNGPTPAQAFADREPIDAYERDAFKRTLAKAAKTALQTHIDEWGTMPACSQRSAIDRKATQHTLQEHGYLEFRRGRLSTLVSTWRADIKA